MMSGVVDRLLLSGDPWSVVVLPVDREVVRADAACRSTEKFVPKAKRSWPLPSALTPGAESARPDTSRNVAPCTGSSAILVVSNRTPTSGVVLLIRGASARTSMVSVNPARWSVDVHHGVLIERDGDPGTHVFREAAPLDRQLVLAHRNVEEPIESILADRRSDCVRRDIPDCHHSAGHHRLLLVADSSPDRAGRGLCGQAGWKGKAREHRQQAHARAVRLHGPSSIRRGMTRSTMCCPQYRAAPGSVSVSPDEQVSSCFSRLLVVAHTGTDALA